MAGSPCARSSFALALYWSGRWRVAVVLVQREREQQARESDRNQTGSDAHHFLDGNETVTWSIRRKIATFAERKGGFIAEEARAPISAHV